MTGFARPMRFGPQRILHRLVAILVLALAPLSANAEEISRAAHQMFKGVELYSWNDSLTGKLSSVGGWNFSLLPGTNRNKSLTEILGGPVINGEDELRQRLSRLAEGESVFWTCSTPPLACPPAEMVDRITRFATSIQINLIFLNETAKEQESK